MSIKSSRDEPFIPKDSTIPVGKKHKDLKLKKMQSSHINALTTKITEAAQTESSKKPLELKKSKKSTKEERERKLFAERAKDLGFKFNNENNTYQSIKEPGKPITIEEMEDLMKENALQAETLIESEKLISETDPARLPDVFKQILSNLDTKELNEARLVSKAWSDTGNASTIARESLLLESFVRLLAENLEDDNRTKLMDLFKSSNSKSKDLTELKSELLDLREKIVHP